MFPLPNNSKGMAATQGKVDRAVPARFTTEEIAMGTSRSTSLKIHAAAAPSYSPTTPANARVHGLPKILLLPVLVLLPGCLVTQTGGLEVLNPKQAYGQTLAVVDDLHRENEAIEKRLASDLRSALSKRGLTIAEDPAKADLVVVPTLGRMRERAPTPVAPVEEAVPVEASEPVATSEPVIAAPAPEARPFHRFSSANVITRGDLISRRAVPSARVPATAQQAGLLLTAYRAADYQDYGMGRQSLPPVWRVYVSQPAVRMKWNSVAVPLINAAASAAAPLGKAPEGAPAGNRNQATGDRPDSPVEKKKGSVFRLFGRSVEQTE